jgi:DNA polymerase-3 subunit beta
MTSANRCRIRPLIEFTLDEQKLLLRSGRSRFTLSTCRPAISRTPSRRGHGDIHLNQLQAAGSLIDRTAFSMAQQDVRYYLNGMLFEVTPTRLRAVATDGHRLAMATFKPSSTASARMQVIVPRKGVLELLRLSAGSRAEDVRVVLGHNHFHATTGVHVHLEAGRWQVPGLRACAAARGRQAVIGSRGEVKEALTRTAILSNEKYRGVRLRAGDGNLQILANNPEQEEAEEQVGVELQRRTLEIGFNVSYLLDVLGA